jgi:hypothetical protein
MTVNLKPKRSAINTGFNVMDTNKVSPSLNLLGTKPIADVAPNEDQILNEVADTIVSEVPVEGPQVTEEPTEPQVTNVDTDVNIPETLRRPEEPVVESTLNNGVTQVAVDSTLPVDSNDPFSDALDPADYLATPVDTNPLSEDLGSDEVRGVYKSKEVSNWEAAKGSFLKGLTAVAQLYSKSPANAAASGVIEAIKDPSGTAESANKLAYGGVKGLAGTADVMTAPGWIVGHLLADGQKFPFTSLLESHYPEKLYQFDDDPDSISDEIMRMSQTGMEFISGGALTNVAAKAVTKGAYVTSMQSDVAVSAVSSFGYQGALEMGASETTALLASFLAPASPELTKAFYKVATKGAYETTVKPMAWAFGKATDYMPLTGLIKRTARATVNDSLQMKKQELIANPEMWNDTFWKRKAREIVVNTTDRVKSLEEQQAEIASIQRWVNSVIPDSQEVREHVFRMSQLQDNINKELPQDKQIAFTLEQIYTPILKKTNSDSGMKEVMAMLRLSNGEAYDMQVQRNREALFEYLSLKKDTLGPEETKAFTSIFDTYLDDIANMQETIYALSRNEDLIDPSKTTGYMYPDEPVSVTLRPTLANIRSMLDEAYSAMLERLPQNQELDTTPLKDAVNEVYESLGVFADPSAMPAYLKDVSKALVKNADTGSEAKSTYDALKKEASVLSEENRNINRVLREKIQENKKALAAMDPKDVDGIAKLKLEQADIMLKIRSTHTDLLNKQGTLNAAKREAKIAASKTELSEVPEPNLVTVGDLREGLKVVNEKLRNAYKDRGDEYSILLKIKRGLEESMEGLRDIDEDAYNLFNTTNGHYREFVAKDYNASNARKIMEQDHLYKITSPDAVKLLWDNADSEDMLRFISNFNGERPGLASYLDNLKDPESKSNLEVRPIDLYSYEAAKGVEAVKDMIYTSLARQVDLIDADAELDPAMRMEKIKKVLIDFQHKHQSKLEKIPGMETLSEDITGTIGRIAKYRSALKELDDQKNMSILRDVVGPGKTASRLMNNHTAAREMYHFLTDQLPNVDIDGTGKLVIPEATANAIRKSLSHGFINEYTHNGVIDYEALDRVLATGTETRNNLSLVLGESEVIKLDAFRLLGRAMVEGKKEFSEVLTDDTTLRKLDQLGLPLGRIGSLLQRRAVFTPTGGYVAGAIISKVLDSMGNKQTSRAMQLMVERPFDILNLDQLLLREMKDLPPHQKRQLEDVMTSTKRHMRELAAWFPANMSRVVQAQMAYLGYEASTREVEDMIADVLYEDPRHPEFNKQEVEVPKKKEIPKTLQRPESQMEPSDEYVQYMTDNDPLAHHDLKWEGAITDGMAPDDAAFQEQILKFQAVKSQGIPKEQLLKVIESLGMSDNTNKEVMLRAVDSVYDRPEDKPSEAKEN